MSGFSLLQETLDPIDREAMARAFDTLDFLRGTDVKAIAKHAFGVLIDNLPRQQAEAACEALRREDIACSVVERRRLFDLPGAVNVRRMDVADDGLTWYDTLDRPHRIAWADVTLVAAGFVRAVEIKRDELESVASSGTYRFALPSQSILTTEAHTMLERLEVFCREAGETIRLRVDGKRFNYRYLGDRMTPHAHRNFVLLVRDVVAHAGDAVKSRGAASIADPTDQVAVYPNAAAYDEELAWYLWRSKQ